MVLTNLIGLALLPVIFIGTYVYIRDSYEREPILSLLKAFFFGCLSVLPVLFVGSFLNGLTPMEDPYRSAYIAFVVAASNEEFFKLMMFLLFIKFSKHYNERLDGIVYAVYIALGFAAVENILYVTRGGIETGILRSFTAVPAHAIFGVFMGYHYSRAKFDGTSTKWHYFLCLAFPILWHGLYNFILMVAPYLQTTWGLSIATSFIGFGIFVFHTYRMGIKRINIFRKFSKIRWGNIKPKDKE